MPGFDIPTTHQGLEFGRRHGLKTTVGIHPHIASTVDDAMWEQVRELAARSTTSWASARPASTTTAASARVRTSCATCERHITLAYETGESLTLHCRSKPGERDAQDDLIRLLRDGGAGSAEWQERFGDRPPGVLHSYSGPVDYAEAALEMGFLIAFGGLVFRRGEEPSADVARITPLDRILTETDSPYLKPRKVKGSRNQPLNVAVTANWLFDLRDDDRDAFGQALVDNFDRFVGVG